MIRSFIIGMVILLIAGNAYATDYYYHLNHKDVVNIIEKRVQINADTYLGSNGYYALGETIRIEKETDLASQVDILKEENAKLIAKIDALIEACIKGGTMPVPQPQPNNPPLPGPIYTELDGKVFALLKANCFNCHKNSANGLQLFTDDGLSLANLSLKDIENVHYRTEGVVLSSGETLMPKGRPPLSVDDMKLIKRWMHEKAQGE